MLFKENKNKEGLFKSIALAYFVLIMHILLAAALGLVVIFFGGLAQNFLWIFLGGMLLIAFSAYLFFRRLRKEGRSLREAMQTPMFQGRSVEISFMGGMASLKLGAPTVNPEHKVLEVSAPQQNLLLEDPDVARIKEIENLARLLEKNLITPEEFAAAKAKLLGFDHGRSTTLSH
ncbi:MAG: SHOCT domain-containing protein [Desulfobacteraceae bacterium]|nr:SHOCT domain-containing protein [Desulfobacteraceae bacterium]